MCPLKAVGVAELATPFVAPEWEELRSRVCAGRPLVTLGPFGTSSHDAARYLQGVLAADAAVEPKLALRDTFEEVLSDCLSERAPLALVPSAYSGATLFHWHPELGLVFHFARATPRYGIAAATPGATLAGGEPVRVAAMREVEQLWEDLAPGVANVRVPAHSTRHAAALVVSGDADVAVTNDPSRAEAGLQWVRSCPGADIVWLVFSRRTHPRPPDTG